MHSDLQIGVEIVWDNQSTNEWILYQIAYLVSPADFVGVDDIITNLSMEREPGIEILECSP